MQIGIYIVIVLLLFTIRIKKKKNKGHYLKINSLKNRVICMY